MESIYLETILRRLSPKRDVLIYLSSAHAVYGEPDEAPTYRPDSLGNHHAETWLAALDKLCLSTWFQVAAMVSHQNSNEDKQVTIYLTCTESYNHVHGLRYTANEMAQAIAFNELATQYSGTDTPLPEIPKEQARRLYAAVNSGEDTWFPDGTKEIG